MDYSKSDALIKKVKIAVLIAVMIVIAAFCIIKRNSIVPGWHGEGEEKYYITFPFKRATGIKTIDGNDYLFADYGENHLLYGWNKYDDFYYYSREDGTIAKGEMYVDGEKYCFEASTGKLYKNTTYILNGKLWYFDDHGFKVYGIIEHRWTKILLQ